MGKIFVDKENFDIHFDKKLEKMISLYNRNFLDDLPKYSEKIKKFKDEKILNFHKNKFFGSKKEIMFSKEQNSFFINDINFCFDKNNVLKSLIYKNIFYIYFFVCQDKFLIKKINIKDFELHFIKIVELF